MTRIYTLPDGRELKRGQAFELNDQSYPSKWLQLATPQDLANRGITVADVPAPEPEPPTVDDLKAYAAEKRRMLANGSTVVDVGGGREIPVWTDPESRGAILGLVVAAQMDTGITTQWKDAAGEFHVLNAAEITALALGMMAFIQVCFSAEATVLAAIEADPSDITSFENIDAAEWPVSA